MEKYCRYPWNQLTIYSKEIAPCCYTEHMFHLAPNENLSNTDILKTPYFLDFQDSIANGSYKYCNEICPTLYSFDKKPLHETPNVELKDLVLNNDQSCNLSCPSCRTDYQLQVGEQFSHRLVEEILSNQGDKIEIIHLSGTGEAIFSKDHRKWLMGFSKTKFPNIKKITLATNGILFTKELWSALPLDLKEIEIVLIVSIDAFEEQTYKKVRRGGDFNLLMRNMDFITELFQRGEIRELVVNFILQKSNYYEMLRFIQKAQIEWKVSAVNVNEITLWKTMDPKHFEEEAIWQLDHKLHAEFLKTIKNPHLEGIVYQGIHRDILASQFKNKIDHTNIYKIISLFELIVDDLEISSKNRDQLLIDYPSLDLYSQITESDRSIFNYHMKISNSFFEKDGLTLGDILYCFNFYWHENINIFENGLSLIRKNAALTNALNKTPDYWCFSLKGCIATLENLEILRSIQEGKSILTFIVTSFSYEDLIPTVEYVANHFKIDSFHIYQVDEIKDSTFIEVLKSKSLIGTYYNGPQKDIWNKKFQLVLDNVSPFFYVSLFKLALVVKNNSPAEKAELKIRYPHVIQINDPHFDNAHKLKYRIEVSSIFFEQKSICLWNILLDFCLDHQNNKIKNDRLGYEIWEIF